MLVYRVAHTLHLQHHCLRAPEAQYPSDNKAFSRNKKRDIREDHAAPGALCCWPVRSAAPRPTARPKVADRRLGLLSRQAAPSGLPRSADAAHSIAQPKGPIARPNATEAAAARRARSFHPMLPPMAPGRTPERSADAAHSIAQPKGTAHFRTSNHVYRPKTDHTTPQLKPDRKSVV